MSGTTDKKIVFFGCPLDCDEKYDSIQEKLNGLWTMGKSDDPFDEVMAFIRPEVQQDLWREIGSVNVPTWLRPKPCGEDILKLSTEKFITFIDENGCRRIAADVEEIVSKKILPDVPCMIGIDHSLTGGAYKSVTEFYGRENVSLIVIDSHTDAIPMSALSDAIQYDIDTNPGSVHDPGDPFLYNRPDSYNSSSFIHHMASEGIINPKNLYIFGVSDYPDKKSFRIKDPRISRYTGAYADLKRSGAKIMTKKECSQAPQKLKTVLQMISTPYAYISIDMDIGAISAVEGVRFRNWQGLTEDRIYKLVDALKNLFARKIQLAGMDITEFDQRRAGEIYHAGRDQTFRIAANLIKKIGFGL
jgi:arginase family enzyme